MKTKLLLLVSSCLFIVSLQNRGYTQAASDHNQGLTATYSSTQDTVGLSWWGSEGFHYQVHVTEDLDGMVWTALPELFLGNNEPIHLGFSITGEGENRMFYRVIKLPPPFAALLAENSNMVISRVRFIGNENMRALLTDGLNYFPNDPEKFFDSGVLFSTGNATEWNLTGMNQSTHYNMAGDIDLDLWMLNAGFGWEVPTNDLDQVFWTRDASGIEIDFSLEPSVANGRIALSYLFASEEYYIPTLLAQNDAMGIFIAELDSLGKPIQESQVNLGVLAETETHSRAINIFNAGDIQVVTPTYKSPPHTVNIDESGFINNSPKPEHHDGLQNPPPYDFGYAGFTSRLLASGGVARVDTDIDVRTRLKQANVVGVGAESFAGEKGWGGILIRGSNRWEEITYSNFLTGYVAAFGLKSGIPEVTLYKAVDLDTNKYDGYMIPNEEFLPKKMDQEPEDLWVLSSKPISNFDANAWYWIRVKAEGDRITVKIWKDGQIEPAEWTIDYTDLNDPIASGFVGLIHPDTYARSASEVNDMRWDLFEILAPQGSTEDLASTNPANTPLPVGPR